MSESKNAAILKAQRQLLQSQSLSSITLYASGEVGAECVLNGKFTFSSFDAFQYWLDNEGNLFI
ncbi:hypothetical protein [Fastidiosibacter lacustris]|uniref:hypothetical protein n=1 Tax=Fastidiosibacter lacustris TaxID=2056695 RepID=UPI000E35684D|nr:hypothetical protein [Fastidiosibacter lacustris]